MDAPVVTMKQLLEAGVHFGHQTRRWNPKMKRFIFGERNGIYIIDLQQTLSRIETAYSFVRDLVADGGTILFIGTKKQAQDPIQFVRREVRHAVHQRALARRHAHQLRDHRQARRRRCRSTSACATSGEFEAMPKKEALLIGRELEKLERNLGGIRDMEKLPDAVFILDTKKEHIAVTEANKLGIPIVAVVDTNCDPDVIQYVIPGNDDAIRSGTLMCRVIADAVEEGRFIASRRGGGTGRPAGARAHRRGRGSYRRPAGRGPPPGCAARAGARSRASPPRATAAPVRGRRRGRCRRRAAAPRPPLPDDRGERRAVAGRRRPRPTPTHRAADDAEPDAPTAEPATEPIRGVLSQWPSSPPRTSRPCARHRRRDDGRQEGPRGERRRHGSRRQVAPREGPGQGRGPLGPREHPRRGRGGDRRRRRARSSSSSARPTSPPRADAFTALVQTLADAVLADGEGAVDGYKDAVDDLKITTKENIELGTVVRFEAADGNVLDTYLHRQDGRGVNAVLVELQGGVRGAGPRHRRAHRVREADVPDPRRGPGGRDRRRSARRSRHHPRRGQARAGCPEDRRGPPQRLVSRTRCCSSRR